MTEEPSRKTKTHENSSLLSVDVDWCWQQV